MTRVQQTVDGIVLRTYDVGEADRLCIVFGRERGRFPARARAVRKLGSRMGALLLPGRRLTMDVRDEGKGATVVAAKLNGDVADFSQVLSLAAAQQGIELLLQLTEDDEPLPAVFDLLFQFLHVCGVDPERSLLAFQLRLFHLLGLLPSHLDDPRFTSLSAAERASVMLCGRTGDFAVLCEGIGSTDGLRSFAGALLAEHARHDLKSAAVYAALAN
jgi:recombinational DNA repair protein (RecF pathway)